MTARTPRQWAESAADWLAVYATDPQVSLVTEEEGAPIRQWGATITDTLTQPRMRNRLGLKAWLTAHADATIETLQVRFGTRDFDEAVAGVWAPGPRRFRVYQSSVAFYRQGASASEFSSRYFAGLWAVASTPDVWVGWAEEPETIIVYRVIVPAEREDYAWSEVAEKDAAGLCPSSPNWEDPHIPAGDGTCAECGATIDEEA